jgi:hypothetical protein
MTRGSDNELGPMNDDEPDHALTTEPDGEDVGGRTRRLALAGALATVTAACAAPSRTTGAPTPTAAAKPTTSTKPTTTKPAPTPTTTAVPPVTQPAPTTTVGAGGVLPWPSTWASPQVWHTAKRCTYGPTPALVAEIAAAGPTAWIDAQLTLAASVDAALDAQLAAAYPFSRGSGSQIAATGQRWNVVPQLPAATLVRAVCASRQVFELAVSFFWDHLSVDINHEGVQAYGPSYDSDVIRAHTFGRFDDMLVASARSGAMLQYLDQASSRADGGRIPNENYARELMELHTVGVDGGYSEDDVKAVAHLLTGWSLPDSWNGGAFTFRSTWHRLGPFQDATHSVLGWQRGGLTGQAAGESFLRHLAAHPMTASRLAHKLAVRFIGEHVRRTDAVVAAAAAAYTANGTNVVPLLRVLLTSAELAASADRRIRRPAELFAATVRATAGPTWSSTRPVDTMWNTHWIMGPLSGTPHHWPAPNGYPDADGKWTGVGANIGRWNLATHVGGGGVPGYAVDWGAVHTWTTGATWGHWFDAAAERLGVVVDAASKQRILAAASRTPSAPLRPTEDRWAYPRVLTLLLQSPQFQTR